MFTDIVGSTALRDALIAAHGGAGDRLYRERVLDPHDRRIRDLLKTHNGFEVKTIGDSFMAAFAEAEDGVLCAAAIQRSLRDDPIPVDDRATPLAVRIGMHSGAATLVERDGRQDYDGHAVNIAARVESLLKGGERAYCSRETAMLAKNAPGVRFHSYGPYPMKGLAEPVEVFDILWDAAMRPDPPPQAHERLPYPWLTPWIGRERAMEDLADALRARRLVTLHGTGGVGKTRLAVETLLARSGGLPREVVFVSLERAANTEEGLLAAVRDANGLTEVDAPDFETLCRQLHGGDRLLLLDNFESVAAASPLVPRLAAAAGVRVLVTTQQVLGVRGEHVTELDPMATAGDLSALESYRLFAGLAQQRDARWQPDDAAAMRDVLAATDGLPYLIELVAAVAPKRRLRQLADELKTHLTEVRARGEDALRPDRHAGVQACLEWATERLPPDERMALPRLAVFSGGFDAEAAGSVAATPIETLDVLVDTSLLRFDRQSGRYSMLPTTRQFALERLDSGDRRDLAARHARWFIEHLDRADDALRAKGGESQAAARRWIDAEWDNVQQAIARAEEDDPALFHRAVRASDTYMTWTCRFSERVRLNETLLGRTSRETSASDWAMAQNNLGAAYRNLPTGDQEENLRKAIGCYEAALLVRTEGDFPARWAVTQNNLGIAYANLPTGERGENLSKAIGCFEAALRVWSERDFPVDWATTQNNLGVAYAELPASDREENLRKAIGCYDAALRVWSEQDFPANWATTQSNLGNAYRNLPTGERGENLSKAIGCYEEALRVQTERDFPAAWAVTQNNLGNAYASLPIGHRRKNLQKAIGCYEAALRVWSERDFPADWAMTQNNLGTAYLNLPTGDRGANLRKVIDCYEAALRVWSERDFPADWAMTQYNLGIAFEQQVTAAEAHYRKTAILCFESAARGFAAVGLIEDAEDARQRAARLREG
jgi:class 3 adenylate cyclase/predicted ATPase